MAMGELLLTCRLDLQHAWQLFTLQLSTSLLPTNRASETEPGGSGNDCPQPHRRDGLRERKVVSAFGERPCLGETNPRALSASGSFRQRREWLHIRKLP